MYDDACRFLAENYSADFASWLLGIPVSMTEIQPSELLLEPIRAELKLEEEAIYRLVRRDIMQESVIYRSIQREAEERAEARKQREIALNFLRDGLSVEAVARGTGLSIKEVQQLEQQLNQSSQN